MEFEIVIYSKRRRLQRPIGFDLQGETDSEYDFLDKFAKLPREKINIEWLHDNKLFLIIADEEQFLIKLRGNDKTTLQDILEKNNIRDTTMRWGGYKMRTLKVRFPQLLLEVRRSCGKRGSPK